MKRTTQVFITMALLLAAVNVFAGQWTSAQKEVWKNVLAYSDLYDKGDIEGFIRYIHEDFSGWHNSATVPESKEVRAKYLRHFAPQSKTVFSDLTPLAIKIHGNVAIVHYLYSSVSKRGDEKEKMSSGRWTDILIKQGDKWVMIADHGGADPSK